MITQARLRELFDLDETTGVFTWRQLFTKNQVKPGDVAGGFHKRTGYWRIKIDGRVYLRSRLVFCYVHGYFPEEIDHKHFNKIDDRPSELRPATRSEQCQHRRGWSKLSKLPKGVSLIKNSKRNPFQSEIQVDKKRIYLGCFPTKEEAALAYQNAAVQHFGEFAI